MKFTLLSDKRHLIGRTVESVIMVIHVPLQESRKRQEKHFERIPESPTEKNKLTENNSSVSHF